MKDILAVNSNTYHGFTVDEMLEAVAATQFKQIEIAAVRGWTEHIMPDLPESEIVRIMEKATKLGLKIVGMSGHCPLTDSEQIEAFRKNMALAHRLGCSYIVSTAGPIDMDDPDTVIENNLRGLLADLEAYDMVLALENHGVYGSGESLKRIVDRIGSQRIGLAYDTGNTVLHGGVHPEIEIDSVMPAIRVMHLKDKVGFDKVWNFPAIGQGDLPLEEIIGKVKAYDADMPYSIEVELTEAFTTRPKVAGDIDIVNKAVMDSYEAFCKMR